MTTQLQIVPFALGDILTICDGDQINVVMPAVCKQMGLDWEPQRQRIERHPIMAEGTCIMQVPSAGGVQSMVVMTLEAFHTFLVTLHPDRITDPEVRERVLIYQRRAFRAVFEHFHGPLRIKPPKALSPFELVRVGNLLKKETNRKVRARLWDRYEQVTDSWGLPRGERTGIGYDAPDYDDILAEFWAAVRGLEELGVAVNQSVRNDVIALNLPDLRAKFLQSEVPIEIGRALTEALRHSESPRFIAEKTVRCHDGKTRFCWVFNAVAELPLLS